MPDPSQGQPPQGQPQGQSSGGGGLQQLVVGVQDAIMQLLQALDQAGASQEDKQGLAQIAQAYRQWVQGMAGGGSQPDQSSQGPGQPMPQNGGPGTRPAP